MNRRRFLNLFGLLPVAAPAAIAAAASEPRPVRPVGGFQTVRKGMQGLCDAFQDSESIRFNPPQLVRFSEWVRQDFPDGSISIHMAGGDGAHSL
jgi:hypothetical protein